MTARRCNCCSEHVEGVIYREVVVEGPRGRKVVEANLCPLCLLHDHPIGECGICHQVVAFCAQMSHVAARHPEVLVRAENRFGRSA